MKVPQAIQPGTLVSCWLMEVEMSEYTRPPTEETVREDVITICLNRVSFTKN